MTLRKKTSQTGFSLIIAVAIITLLTLFGLMVLDAVFNDVQLAGGDRASQNALYIAEAGIAWSKQVLIDILYPPGTSGATANVSGLTSLTPLSYSDPLCPENNCTEQPCPPTINCSGWYLLTPGGGTGFVSYGTGSYRVAATCNPNNCAVLPPQTYSIRSLGYGSTATTGPQRLLEVTLGP